MTLPEQNDLSADIEKMKPVALLACGFVQAARCAAEQHGEMDPAFVLRLLLMATLMELHQTYGADVDATAKEASAAVQKRLASPPDMFGDLFEIGAYRPSSLH